MRAAIAERHDRLLITRSRGFVSVNGQETVLLAAFAAAASEPAAAVAGVWRGDEVEGSLRMAGRWGA